MPINDEMAAVNRLFNCDEWDFEEMARDSEYLAKFVPDVIARYLPGHLTDFDKRKAGASVDREDDH